MHHPATPNDKPLVSAHQNSPIWYSISDHAPPADPLDGRPGQMLNRRVLVTNNMPARTAIGQMMNVWFARPVWEEGSQQWIAFGGSAGRIAGITHWLDPLNNKPFQERVSPWMEQCFGAKVTNDPIERNHRFLEEAVELVQSLGCSALEAHIMVDYVYGRDAGEPKQEVGGVMVTLAALCLAHDIDMHECAEVELARVWTKVEQIRDRQASKPRPSPNDVPGAKAVAAWTTASMDREPISDALKMARPDLYDKHYTRPLYA